MVSDEEFRDREGGVGGRSRSHKGAEHPRATQGRHGVEDGDTFQCPERDGGKEGHYSYEFNFSHKHSDSTKMDAYTYGVVNTTCEDEVRIIGDFHGVLRDFHTFVCTVDKEWYARTKAFDDFDPHAPPDPSKVYSDKEGTLYYTGHDANADYEDGHQLIEIGKVTHTVGEDVHCEFHLHRKVDEDEDGVLVTSLWKKKCARRTKRLKM